MYRRMSAEEQQKLHKIIADNITVDHKSGHSLGTKSDSLNDCLKCLKQEIYRKMNCSEKYFNLISFDEIL